jgi:hypothetical protein
MASMVGHVFLHSFPQRLHLAGEVGIAYPLGRMLKPLWVSGNVACAYLLTFICRLRSLPAQRPSCSIPFPAAK